MKIPRLNVCLVIVLVVFVLLGVYPCFSKAKRGAIKARGINHMRSVAMAMDDFGQEYGHYPCSEIPEELQLLYPQSSRTDSNYILGQLLAAGSLDDKMYFQFAKEGGRAADNVTPSSEGILAAGECDFACVSKIDGKSPSEFSRAPILIAPINPVTRRFDPEIFNGKALVANSDGTVSEARIDSEGVVWRKVKTPAGVRVRERLLAPKGAIGTPTIHYPLPSSKKDE